MKRMILFIFLCCTSILCFSQHHLTFMGLPIDGTITSFQNKLIKKGLRPSSSNKYLPLGVRLFEGYFTNESAKIYVFYNNKSKIVYMCRVVFDYLYNSKSDARVDFASYKAALGNKYDAVSFVHDDMQDKENDYSDAYNWLVMQPPIQEDSPMLGFIELKIEEADYAFKYQLWIDYIDAVNQVKNIDIKNSDL